MLKTIIVDDLDGSEDASPVSFMLDGTSYEIDLSAGNERTLRELVGGYVSHARPAVQRRATRPGVRRGPAAGGRGPEVRAWAREHGFEVKPQGAIPKVVLREYEAARG